MSTEKINHNALTHLIDAGAITSATAFADGDTWALKVKVADTTKVVMAKNSGKPRIWRKLDTLAKYLQKLGLKKFEIDVSNYNSEKKSLRRPDSAASLKLTHQAHKARKPNTLKQKLSVKPTSSEKAKEKWEERRARILAEENPRVK